MLFLNIQGCEPGLQMTLLPWTHLLRYILFPKEKQTATQLLQLAPSYRPETKQETKQEKPEKAAGKRDDPTKRPPVLQAGVNTVTTWVENKKAQLVVSAHDVDPIELFVFLPVLEDGCSLLHYQGKGQVGTPGPQKTCNNVVFTVL
ncbi:60S ribosomal protein L7a [Tupaia chinensis]|uniref:60S ribosomal protein L7a n=1 Tax=Tupaia chinensis TaxID=246437 RepID=L9JFR0_TUPCH|nr:60S ribosomal protein L7a [Tupaia chinensis]